jgi:transcriptional regulator with XRE-family HTH domain
MPSKSQFGKYIAKRRKEVGITTEALAEQVGTSRSALFYWETGKWLPSVSQLEPLAQALNVSYEDLFTRAGYDLKTLPTPEPYLRTRYPNASTRDMTEAKRLFERMDAAEHRRKGKRS